MAPIVDKIKENRSRWITRVLRKEETGSNSSKGKICWIKEETMKAKKENDLKYVVKSMKGRRMQDWEMRRSSSIEIEDSSD